MLKKSSKNEGSYLSSLLKRVVPPCNRLSAPGSQEEAAIVTSECKEKRRDKPLVWKREALWFLKDQMFSNFTVVVCIVNTYIHSLCSLYNMLSVLTLTP